MVCGFRVWSGCTDKNEIVNVRKSSIDILCNPFALYLLPLRIISTLRATKFLKSIGNDDAVYLSRLPSHIAL